MDRIERCKQKFTEFFGDTVFSAITTDPDFTDILNYKALYRCAPYKGSIETNNSLNASFYYKKFKKLCQKFLWFLGLNHVFRKGTIQFSTRIEIFSIFLEVITSFIWNRLISLFQQEAQR